MTLSWVPVQGQVADPCRISVWARGWVPWKCTTFSPLWVPCAATWSVWAVASLTVCCCSSCWNHVTLADALPCLLFDARMLLERAHVVHRIVVWSRACAPAALCFPRVKGAISWWVCSSQVGVGKGRSLAPASGVGYLEAWGPICLHSLSESPLLTYGVDGNW